MTREEAIKNIKEHCYFANLIPQAKEALEMAIKALKQEPKIGHWIGLQLIPDDITGHMCGECSMCHKVRIVDNYCPSCGAKMVEPQERSGEE